MAASEGYAMDKTIIDNARIPARARGPFRIMSWETGFSHHKGKRAGRKVRAYAVVPSNYPACLAVEINGARSTEAPSVARALRRLANSAAITVAAESELPI